MSCVLQAHVPTFTPDNLSLEEALLVVLGDLRKRRAIPMDVTTSYSVVIRSAPHRLYFEVNRVGA